MLYFLKIQNLTKIRNFWSIYGNFWSKFTVYLRQFSVTFRLFSAYLRVANFFGFFRVRIEIRDFWSVYGNSWSFFRYLRSISGKPPGRSLYSNSWWVYRFLRRISKNQASSNVWTLPQCLKTNRPRSAPSRFGKPKVKHGCKLKEPNPAIGAHHAQPSEIIEDIQL